MGVFVKAVSSQNRRIGPGPPRPTSGYQFSDDETTTTMRTLAQLSLRSSPTKLHSRNTAKGAARGFCFVGLFVAANAWQQGKRLLAWRAIRAS